MKSIIISANLLSQVINFRLGLIRELKKKYKLYVLAALDDPYFLKKIEEENINYIEVPLERRGKNIYKDLKLLIFYKKIFKELKPEYVLQFTIKPNIYGSIAGRLARIKTINNVTGLGPALFEKKLSKYIIKILYMISFKYPKKVFFQNDDDLEYFLNNKLINLKICGRLPGSGVNIEKFRPLEKKKIDNKFKFLFLGRINENKGVRLIYEASKRLKDKYPRIEFQLLGKVYEDEKTHISKKELAEWEKETNIKYLGTSKDVRKEIKECDVILFPSYYREGVPRSLIEAAAMGKPIITTNNVGCKDIVEDNYNGFLAEPNNLESLIEKIEKMISINEEERKKLGLNGRIKVEEQFDERIVIDRYLEIIDMNN